MPPTLADRLEHILSAICDVQTLLSNLSVEDFAKDKYRRVAVGRFFEIISEASRHIPDDVKAQQTEINWRRMADLGNRLRPNETCPS
jgi:uncharacterized protein with HEPN domain